MMTLCNAGVKQKDVATEHKVTLIQVKKDSSSCLRLEQISQWAKTCTFFRASKQCGEACL